MRQKQKKSWRNIWKRQKKLPECRKQGGRDGSLLPEYRKGIIMIEKMVENLVEVNDAAAHLRNQGDMEALRRLAKKWAIPYKQTEDFIQGRRYRLTEIPIEQKTFRTASEKLREEILVLDDKDFAGIIGWHIIQKSEADPKLAISVMKKHKSLQRCLDFVMEKAFETATEQAKKKGLDRVRENTALTVTEKTVFPWAEEYYRREDEDETRAKEAAKKKEILLEWKQEELKSIPDGEKAVTKRGAGKTKESAPKKKETDGQMSLFDLA